MRESVDVPAKDRFPRPEPGVRRARRPRPTADLAPDPRAGVRGMWLRRLVVTALTLVVLAGLLGLLGVHTTSVSRRAAGGETLEVHYANVARAGLGVPFEITVRHPGGFHDDVVLAVSSRYLGLFDSNGVTPTPVSGTADDQAVVWRFHPPRGDTLVVSFDLSVQAGRHWGTDGFVTLEDTRGHQLGRVSFRTHLAP